ncbi:MAG: hypothetical protein E7354_03560 [Clostridiales bacterium]|nr:hypothetical protein [Clostridiales bacterium]
MADSIDELYEKNRLIVRAMDWPRITRVDGSNFAYDFSTWAGEIALAQSPDGLTSASSTLLVPGVDVPTYKSIGFMINGDTAEIEHISETDSSSCGNKANGDFYAFGESLADLDELVSNIREKHTSGVMNEVNITISPEDIVGLFYSSSSNDRNRLYALLAKYMIAEQMQVDLPIYEYDSKNGSISLMDMDLAQQQEFLRSMFDSKVLRTPLLHYALDSDEMQTINIADKIKEQMMSNESAMDK